MLTRDLLRFRNLSGYAKPAFLDETERKTLDLAAELLETWRAGTEGFRKETESAINALSARWTDLKLPKGLSKVIADSSVFSGDDSAAFPAEREKLFLASAELLSSDHSLSPETFRQTVFQRAGIMLRDAPIYADLPDFEKIISVPDWTPQELVMRYNCVLAQSLLLYSSSLEITAEEPDPAKLRRFFKQLRFLRLLATVSMDQDRQGNAKRIRVYIDGPASILENGTKYGLQLASFFPVILPLNSWKMSSVIKPGTHELKFILDSKSNLRGHFGNHSAYIPEEIKMFVAHFRQTSDVWKIVPDAPPFLDLGGQTFLFPDLTFSNGSQTVHLELFHKWHEGQLKDRLAFLAKHPDHPILLGIDRSLFPKKEGGDSVIRENPLYGEKIFLFSGYPGVERVLKLLNRESVSTELF
ncbi:MAG: DUF790 family protein [Lentisphaeria bacterium]|nr:DUF790 family protein [Lentisphaeria bacterium]